MLDTTLSTDMPWVRYLSVRLRRSLQVVMLLYLLLFLWPSYQYGLYLYPEDEMPIEVELAVPDMFGFLGLLPVIFITVAPRLLAVSFSFTLVALVWVGWDSLTHSDKLYSSLTSLIIIAAIPLTSPLFYGFIDWMLDC